MYWMLVTSSLCRDDWSRRCECVVSSLYGKGESNKVICIRYSTVTDTVCKSKGVLRTQSEKGPKRETVLVPRGKPEGNSRVWELTKSIDISQEISRNQDDVTVSHGEISEDMWFLV